MMLGRWQLEHISTALFFELCSNEITSKLRKYQELEWELMKVMLKDLEDRSRKPKMHIIILEGEVRNKKKFSSAETRLQVEKDCRLNEFTVFQARLIRKGTNLVIF